MRSTIWPMFWQRELHLKAEQQYRVWTPINKQKGASDGELQQIVCCQCGVQSCFGYKWNSQEG